MPQTRAETGAGGNDSVRRTLQKVAIELFRFSVAAAVFLLVEIVTAVLFLPELPTFAQDLSDWFDCPYEQNYS